MLFFTQYSVPLPPPPKQLWRRLYNWLLARNSIAIKMVLEGLTLKCLPAQEMSLEAQGWTLHRKSK